MRLPLETSTGSISTMALALIDLETSAGITGWSYLFAISRANLKPIVALVESMREMLIGDALAQVAGLEMSSHLFPEASCHLLAVTSARNRARQ